MGGLALKRMVANNLREILGKAQDPKRAMREVARGLAEAELLVRTRTQSRWTRGLRRSV